MSNAFAPIVRARPNPIFGRPVHQGSLPFDYSPILLLKPFGFRIAPDTLPSGIRRATGSRSVLAVSGFCLRARLDFSKPSCSPGQRGITPAFGYSAPHPRAEGTSIPMIHALPSAHYGEVRLLAIVHHRLRLSPSRCGPKAPPVVNREISRFPYKERLGILGSSTRPDRSSARDSAELCVAFRTASASEMPFIAVEMIIADHPPG